MENLLHINNVDLSVEDEIHPLDVIYKDEINAYWQKISGANPSLYNGEFYLTVSANVVKDRLCGNYRRTSFATFMYWLHHSTEIEGVFHVFSVAAMVSRDNKIIMGKMAQHTANAGRIYMPAGSISDEDIHDKKADFEGLMMREVREETGISLDIRSGNKGYTMIRKKGVIALVREYAMVVHSTELIKLIEKNLPDLQEQELESVHAYGPGETHITMPEFLKEYQMNRKSK